MFATFKNAWKITELRYKMLFTLLIILIYRLGANLPVPYVSPDALQSFNTATTGSIFSYLQMTLA